MAKRSCVVGEASGVKLAPPSWVTSSVPAAPAAQPVPSSSSEKPIVSSDGSFALVFPYAGALELGCPSGRRSFTVAEAAVQSGSDVAADCP